MLWVILMVAMLGSAAMAETYKGYALPPYRVIEAAGAYELRDYGPHVVAEVTTGGGPRAAVGSGFRALAGYIFGKNAGGEKIAMTAPVVQEPHGDAWAIRFVLPAGRDVSQFPAAQRGDVRLRDEAGGRYFVYRFSGRSAPSRMRAAETTLRAEAADRGLVATGPAQWLYYDDPMTLPFRRRNEVALPVR